MTVPLTEGEGTTPSAGAPSPRPRARLSDWLRLARIPLAATAASDAVACALLARGPGFARGDGMAALSLPDLLLLAATSVLVYVAGMSWNDAFDRDRDRRLHPGRPVASGIISPAAAFAFSAAAAAGAILIGGGPAGRAESVAVALALAFAYDAILKRWLVPGCLAMGGVRAANALTGVLPGVLAGRVHLLALAGPVLLGLYSAGITAHSTSEDALGARPKRLLFARVAAFTAFLGAGVLSVLGADGVTFGIFFAPAVCLSIAFGRVPRRGPVATQVFEFLLGFYWLAAILSSGGFSGRRWDVVLAAFGGAYALIVLSQLFARALRRRAQAA